MQGCNSIENVTELSKTNIASLFLAVFSTVKVLLFIHSTSFEKYTDGRTADNKRSEKVQVSLKKR